MSGEHPIAWLMFFTLAAGVVIAGGGLMLFLRSRHNRHVAERTLVGTDGAGHGPAPDGALPELLGLLAVAAVAMALLLLGYASR